MMTNTQFILMKDFEEQLDIITTYSIHLKHKENNIVFRGIDTERNGMIVELDSKSHMVLSILLNWSPGWEPQSSTT